MGERRCSSFCLALALALTFALPPRPARLQADREAQLLSVRLDEFQIRVSPAQGARRRQNRDQIRRRLTNSAPGREPARHSRQQTLRLMILARACTLDSGQARGAPESRPCVCATFSWPKRSALAAANKQTNKQTDRLCWRPPERRTHEYLSKLSRPGHTQKSQRDPCLGRARGRPTGSASVPTLQDSSGIEQRPLAS